MTTSYKRRTILRRNMLNDMRSKHELNRKLTENDVSEIKKLLKTGLKMKDIAEKFDVSISTIHSIKKGNSWGHVKI